MKLFIIITAITVIASICSAQEKPHLPSPPEPPSMVQEAQSPPLPPQEPPRPPSPPRPDEHKDAFLPPELEKEALDYIKETFPTKLERLNHLKHIRPLEYKENIFRIIEEKARLQELKLIDEERYQQILKQQKLDEKSWMLAEKFKRADSQSRESIKKELMATLNELFDLKENDKKREITRMETELKKLKEMLDYRSKNKERIIEKRFKDMVGESQFLEW